MGKYIHKFESLTDYNNTRQNNYIEPWVSVTNDGEGFIDNYNKTEYESLLEMPLTFEITSDGTINWGHYFGEWSPLEFSRTLEYRKNGGEWTEITSTKMIYNDSTDRYSGGTVINVVSGDVVEFRGNNADFCYFDENIYCIRIFCSFEPSTCGFKLSGNIMSLINSTEYATLTTIESAYTFPMLFAGNRGLTDASNLLLPAITLTHDCYKSMFAGCRNLVNAPELPATNLAENCYASMFFNCMNLNYIKCLATNISATDCTDDWVKGVASTGTFVKASSMNDWATGVNGIPTNWTVQNA